jgi:hypothetical protein
MHSIYKFDRGVAYLGPILLNFPWLENSQNNTLLQRHLWSKFSTNAAPLTVVVKLTQSLRKVSGVLPVTSSHCALVVPPGHTIRLGGTKAEPGRLPYRADLPARADMPDRHDSGQLVGSIRRDTAVYGKDDSLLL